MIKVTGGTGAGRARGVLSSQPARSAFTIGDAAPASSASSAVAAGEAAAPAALGALIALQSDGRGGARSRAMAERALMLLDRLKDGLIEGRVAVADLEALADAASAKPDDPDERIAAIYEEIALRARVELAKLGR
jgi:hypothetical protein